MKDDSMVAAFLFGSPAAKRTTSNGQEPVETGSMVAAFLFGLPEVEAKRGTSVPSRTIEVKQWSRKSAREMGR